MNKNEETLKKMYDIFSVYDINESESVEDKFLEMMSDYKNFNTLMNIAFSLDTSEFVNEDAEIADKRIVYNIKKFGPLYRNIYESYKRCFIENNSIENNVENNSYDTVKNNFVDWCNEQQNIDKTVLLDVVKNTIAEMENNK